MEYSLATEVLTSITLEPLRSPSGVSTSTVRR